LHRRPSVPFRDPTIREKSYISPRKEREKKKRKNVTKEKQERLDAL